MCLLLVDNILVPIVVDITVIVPRWSYKVVGVASVTTVSPVELGHGIFDKIDTLQDTLSLNP